MVVVEVYSPSSIVLPWSPVAHYLRPYNWSARLDMRECRGGEGV